MRDVLEEISLWLFLIAIATGLTLLINWIPKKIGYPRTGKFLATIAGLFFLYLAITTIFEDQLFSKNDANKLLAEQDIKLKDGFELFENKSYFTWHKIHTFRLRISENDKNLIISQIKSSPDFKGLKDPKEDIYSKADKYVGKKVIQNYEEGDQFVRESIRVIKKGYTSIHRKIEIGKKESILNFEDL
jgi:hypothetical protein